MAPAEKRPLLMQFRKEQLGNLIKAYYQERGWTNAGIPKIETLKQIGLWDFLKEETKDRIRQILDTN
jgi:aldehyde:ferredoxin oxidoreductase